MTFAAKILTVIVFGIGVVGCSSDGDGCQPSRCIPILRLDIRGSDGSRLTDGVSITDSASGANASTALCAPSEECSYEVRAPTGSVIISAPGYVSASVPYTPASDSCGNPVSQSATLTLQAESSTPVPAMTRTQSATCG